MVCVFVLCTKLMEKGGLVMFIYSVILQFALSLSLCYL
jgi:hypothetical protein